MRKFFKLLCKLFVILIVFILIFKGVIFLYLKTTPKLEIGSANNILIYDKDKKLFFQGNESKEWTSLKNISKYVIDSTIYTEDKHFYSHNGFDYKRILKASMINISSRSTKQGASTITQQYAKNLFLDFDKTWKRKWDEMWYTLRIENAYSKDEILEGYLNTINYGHGMYGIENASKFYFNKSAKDLDLAEATMITGIPKSPANYSPIVDFDTAKKRQLLVLNSLVENNIITENREPRDCKYKRLTGYSNIIACSYSGNNLGVDLSFDNKLKHYLLSNNTREDCTNITYKTTIDKEKSFISLAATLIPISNILTYYLDGDKDRVIDIINNYYSKFNFNTDCNAYEIFTGSDTSTVSKYLESTLVESGIGIPIVHDKYSFCHGRSTIGLEYNNNCIFINTNTKLDKLLLDNIKDHYNEIIIIDSDYKDKYEREFDMLIKSMYLTKYIAKAKNKDLTNVEYADFNKNLYKYNGDI